MLQILYTLIKVVFLGLVLTLEQGGLAIVESGCTRISASGFIEKYCTIIRVKQVFILDTFLSATLLFLNNGAIGTI